MESKWALVKDFVSYVLLQLPLQLCVLIQQQNIIYIKSSDISFLYLQQALKFYFEEELEYPHTLVICYLEQGIQYIILLDFTGSKHSM